MLKSLFQSLFRRKNNPQEQVRQFKLALLKQHEVFHEELINYRKEHIDTLIELSDKALEASRLATDVYNLANVSEDKELAKWAKESREAALDVATTIIDKSLKPAVQVHLGMNFTNW